MRIDQPGIYDLSAEKYHADPCLRPSASSGILSTIVTDTLADAFWKHPRLNPEFEVEDDTKYDLGSVAHEVVLGKGSGIVAIDAPDWKKQATKDARSAALAEGKQPCLAHVFEKAQAMGTALRRQLDRDEDNCRAFLDGRAEQVAVALHQHPLGPVFCRTMMDWRMTDAPIIYDYKTFAPGPDPDGFVKYLFREGRDVQDPFYSMVLASVLGIDWREVTFRFVVQSPKPPYVASVVELDEQARAFAYERTMWALDRWSLAGFENQWEGYRPRTHYVAAPNYEILRWAEKRQADELADALDARAAA